MSTALKTSSTVINGVDVTALQNTIAAIQGAPAIAKFNFRLSNRWKGGDRNQSTIKDFTGALEDQRTNGHQFTPENGEHAILLGHDDAPNPVEWLLHALIGCMTTTTAYHAAARGITIEAIDSKVDGDLDLRGFLGLSADVRKGYSAIRVTMRVKTKGDPAVLKQLPLMSPVLDVVGQSVPVTINVETY
jgi:uncharacterized OsmC-like protein